MKIVIINGASGAGKDTFIELCQHQDNANIGKVSIVDATKYLASMIGWNGQKTPKNRKFLCDLKDLLDENFDYSFKYIESYVKNRLNLKIFLQSNIDILFIIARSPKDIKRLKEEFNAYTLCITEVAADKNIKNASNHADKEIFDYNYDEYISNDETLKELEIKAKDFVERILRNGPDY